jgi:hypothetical protein
MKMTQDSSGRMTFEMVLTRHHTAYEAFQAAAWAVPIAWRELPGACGSWTPREVVCHSAGWEAEALRRLRTIAANRAIPEQTYDDDQFNASNVAARRELSWVAALADLGSTHAALRAFLRTLTPADLAGDQRFAEWLLGRASDFDDHTAQLRAWRAQTAAANADSDSWV